jgi:hypothetical protein
MLPPCSNQTCLRINKVKTLPLRIAHVRGVLRRSALKCAQQTEYAIEQQGPRPFGVSSLVTPDTISTLITSLFKNANTLYLNQGQNNQ